MPFLILIVGAIVLVVAFQNTQGDLVTALETDMPGFFKWGAAIAAVLGVGYLPGMEKPSRWLLGLVVIVLVLTNYQAIISGFQGFAQGGAASTAAGAAAPDPTSAYAMGATSATPTASEIAGNSGGGGAVAVASAATTTVGSSGTSTASATPGSVIVSAPQGTYGMAATLAGIAAIMQSGSIGFGGDGQAQGTA